MLTWRPVRITMTQAIILVGCLLLASTTTVLTQLEGIAANRHLSQARLDLRTVEWGLGTSAYQVEGGASAAGRQPSIWDVYSKVKGNIYDGTTGDVTASQYSRYPVDVALMKQLKVKYYRFSISWSRLITNAGGPKRSVNKLGVAYYNRLIDSLRANGIQPMVTLYHWDLPKTAWMNELFWLSGNRSKVVDEFVFYADAAFKNFGNRVNYWSTFNEPFSFIMLGYGWGVHAPGRKDVQTGVWRAGYNVLLSHAYAVQLFRTKYQKPGDKIGMNLNCDWSEPMTNAAADIEAAQWYKEFRLGWFADPLYKGDYPASMKALLKDRLPAFTPGQKQLLKGSTDYFALNHYTSVYIKAWPKLWFTNQDLIQYWEESQTSTVTKKVIGVASDSDWLKVVPWGFRKMLVWVKVRYNNPDIWITEQGVSVPGESWKSEADAVNDVFRVNYYRQYLNQMKLAITKNGVKVSKYIAWSALDNFEWKQGFKERFGVIRVDLRGNLARKIKKSGYYLRDVFVYGNGTA